MLTEVAGFEEHGHLEILIILLAGFGKGLEKGNS